MKHKIIIALLMCSINTICTPKAIAKKAKDKVQKIECIKEDKEKKKEYKVACATADKITKSICSVVKTGMTLYFVDRIYEFSVYHASEIIEAITPMIIHIFSNTTTTTGTTTTTT